MTRQSLSLALLLAVCGGLQLAERRQHPAGSNPHLGNPASIKNGLALCASAAVTAMAWMRRLSRTGSDCAPRQ
jgi:hypothetical protein